ncbi:Reverse transcriptase [Phytophthora palmivora]|uniref:Reverse transcriptase n=1 Tax=Phytophthora palmivora TaxID=4796 RepID=A0A2P4Y631_9STRA|nr:Reverse transcriptase [Phytophthora palmivora]
MFGASSMIRHDQDHRFMSELWSRQRTTLGYRPQANGQQECSGQTSTGGTLKVRSKLCGGPNHLGFRSECRTNDVGRLNETTGMYKLVPKICSGKRSGREPQFRLRSGKNCPNELRQVTPSDMLRDYIFRKSSQG